MSWTIYPAYLYKDKAKWNDIPKLIEELFELKKKFVAYCGDKLIAEDYPLKEYFEKGDKYFEFIDRIKKDSDAKYSDATEKGMIYDCSCNIVIYFHKHKIVVQEFAGWVARDFLKENFNYPDYSYYDIYAGDEDITPEIEKEFRQRKSFYESLFVETGIPSNVGLSYDFFNDFMTAMEIADYIRRSLKGEIK